MAAGAGWPSHAARLYAPSSPPPARCAPTPAGMKEAQAVVTSALERLIRGGGGGGNGGPSTQPELSAGSGEVPGAAALARQRRLRQEQEAGGASPIDAPLPLEACDWLNVTACNVTGAYRVLACRLCHLPVVAAAAGEPLAWRGLLAHVCRSRRCSPAPTLGPRRRRWRSAPVGRGARRAGGGVQPPGLGAPGAAARAARLLAHLQLAGHRCAWAGLGWALGWAGGCGR